MEGLSGISARKVSYFREKG